MDPPPPGMPRALTPEEERYARILCRRDPGAPLAALLVRLEQRFGIPVTAAALERLWRPAPPNVGGPRARPDALPRERESDPP